MLLKEWLPATVLGRPWLSDFALASIALVVGMVC
jgi:hypothetical protein